MTKSKTCGNGWQLLTGSYCGHYRREGGMNSEYIKARCREVAKADAALKVRPSAAAVALEYILELEAENERLTEWNQNAQSLNGLLELRVERLEKIKAAAKAFVMAPGWDNEDELSGLEAALEGE